MTDKLEVDGALILSSSLHQCSVGYYDGDGHWIYVFFLISSLNIPTRLLCQMQTNSSEAKFLTTVFKFRKREKMSLSLVYVLPKTWYEAFLRCNRTVMERKCTKKACRVAAIVFWRSRCRRRRGILNFLVTPLSRLQYTLFFILKSVYVF